LRRVAWRFVSVFVALRSFLVNDWTTRLAFATLASAFRFLVRSLRCALVIWPLPIGKSSLTA
jgi:hypothetical protein